jgi:hypothetical protein
MISQGKRLLEILDHLPQEEHEYAKHVKVERLDEMVSRTQEALPPDQRTALRSWFDNRVRRYGQRICPEDGPCNCPEDAELAIDELAAIFGHMPAELRHAPIKRYESLVQMSERLYDGLCALPSYQQEAFRQWLQVE